MNEIPRRRFQMTISLHADDRAALEFALRDLASCAIDGMIGKFASGSSELGYSGELIESPNTTHASYVEELEAYLERQRSSAAPAGVPQ